MAFVEVDPSAIQFDKPGSAPAPGGFVEVDPSKIQFDAPQTDPIRSAYRSVINNVAAPINSAAKSGLSAVGNALSDYVTPEGKQAFSNAVDYVKNSGLGVATGEAVDQAKDEVNDLAQYNTDLKPDLGAFGENAKLLGTVTAAKPVADMVAPFIAKTEIASQALPGLLGDVDSGSQAPKPVTADMVRRAGTNAYDAVQNSGTVFAPSVTDKGLAIIDSAKQKPLFNGTVLTKEQADINSALDDYSAAKGQPMTMQDLQGLDSTLGDKTAQAYVAGNYNKGRILSDVQDKIRNLVQPDKLSPSDIIAGSPEGADILTNHAVPLWSAQAKMQDLERIVDNANNTPNPSSAIQTGFKNLMRNQNKFNQYPEAVQNIIAKTAKSGLADDLLGVVGSRLNQIAGGAVGGAPGYATSSAISMTGRGLRTALKNSQANAALQAMVEQVRPSIEKFADYVPPSPAAGASTAQAPLTLRQIMQMPPAQARIALKTFKSRP